MLQKNILGIIAGCLLVVWGANAFPVKYERYIAAPVSKEEKAWVDSVMKKLTQRERIAQLFMVAAYSNQPQKHITATTDLIQQQKIGGLVFFQGSPAKQAELTNLYQSQTKVPLLIGMDAEWGVAMRLDSVSSFPKQMMLGAISDNELLYDLGVEMARQCKLLGIHINFAPSVDINSNPDNPVINTRSFGENRNNVAQKGIALMRGMQDNGILACAKHFPGHGDTNVDSHHELPTIDYSRDRLDTVELYPFRELISNGIAGVMIGHLYISSIDTKDEIPASFSEKIIRSMLKNDMNFEGLVITDALNMSAVKKSTTEHVAVQALKAGNDILLMPEDVAGGIDAIEVAIKSNELTEEQIDDKCRKVLTAKYRAGLGHYKPINLKELTKRLNTPNAKALNNRLVEKAITLVANRENIVPIKELDNKKIAYLEVGKNKGSAFVEQLSMYADVTTVSIDKDASKEQMATMKKQLEPYNMLIVGYHIADSRPSKNFGVDTILTDFVSSLSKGKDCKTIFCFFGSPYSLSKMALPQVNFDAIVVAYDNASVTQNRTAQLLFGAKPFSGKLSVSATAQLSEGYGIETQELNRLSYVAPEEIGIASKDLEQIDSLIRVAIRQKAIPGCQVLAAYKGQVFYNKVMGTQTYDKNSPRVKSTDLYDVASVTKVSATLPLVMKMVDAQRVDIDDKISKYILLSEKSNKGDIKIKELLIHQAGLQAWIPFYLSMLTVPQGQEVFSNKTDNVFTIQLPGVKRYINKNSTVDKNYFSSKASDSFTLPVASALYASPKTKDYIYNTIDTSKLLAKTYRYSDLGFMYLQRIIENVYKHTEDELADAFFYQPLGMSSTMFLPLDKKIAKTRIAPTEDDKVFRRQLIQGYVHDPAAAMLGGVSGHAGLFSTANDLAKLMQMYLYKGNYGGVQYVDSKIIDEFTAYYNKKQSRRGLGFDKPEPDPKKASPVCKEASASSYGHSGFTGALVWNDPERDLVYVFLSNRIYPSTENMTITKLGTRTEILARLLKLIDQLKVEEHLKTNK